LQGPISLKDNQKIAGLEGIMMVKGTLTCIVKQKKKAKGTQIRKQRKEERCCKDTDI
jgi:hypothetical protein